MLQMTQIKDTPVRGPGRPATGNTKSRADIQRDYRKRQRERETSIRIDRELATHLLAMSFLGAFGR